METNLAVSGACNAPYESLIQITSSGLIICGPCGTDFAQEGLHTGATLRL